MPEHEIAILKDHQEMILARLEKVEETIKSHREDFVALMIELKTLQTKVSLYAALVSAAITLAIKFLT